MLGNNIYETNISDEDVYIGYRRPVLVKNQVDDNNSDLSEYVKARLFVARHLAMLKYKKTWD